jgi:putative copper resistance protein D
VVYLISVWLHVVAACVWVGGLLFFAAVLVPIVKRLGRPATLDFVSHAGRGFRRVGWASLIVLVVTGTYNLFARWTDWPGLFEPAFWRSSFGKTFAVKLSLVLLIIIATLAHDVWGTRAVSGGNPDGDDTGDKTRRTASWLGRVTTLLALVVVLLAVAMVRGWP